MTKRTPRTRRRRYTDSPLITDENLINFQRTREELEIFFLYCGFSVGKSRKQASEALAKLLDAGRGKTPFARVRSHINAGRLREALEVTRIGGWTRLEGFLRSAVAPELDLEKGTVDDYLNVHGIGQAKARFFLLCTREDASCAVLDRHILSHLREAGYPEIPEVAPESRKQYVRIERYWLDEVAKSGLTPAQYNLKRWRERARR